MPAIRRILLEGDFILRDEVGEFENNMASYLGVEHVIGVNSGTDALILALRVVGMDSWDDVLTVSHTFVATVASIYHCHARPIFVDIGNDYNMNAEKLEEAITLRAKVLLPVHLNGHPCDMERLIAIAQKHKLMVVEDACQALGATVNGKKVGTFGLIGCFSLHPLKILSAAGDGGFVATNDDSMAHEIRLLRNHGQRTRDDLALLGFNSRLDNLQAAILNVKFKYLPQWIERRREVARLYNQRLSELIYLKLPPISDSDVYSSYVIRAEKRDALAKYLVDKGIEIAIHHRKPIHLHKSLNLWDFHLPLTEQIADEILSLPIYPELEDWQVEYTAEAIQNFYKGVN